MGSGPFYNNVGSVPSGCQDLAGQSLWEEIMQIRGGGSYANEKSTSFSAGGRAQRPEAHT